MSELVQANYRLRPDQRDYLAAQPDGASSAVRRLIDEAMAKGVLRPNVKRIIIAGDALSFREFVAIHVRSRRAEARRAYIRSPATRDYLLEFGRTVEDIHDEINRQDAEGAITRADLVDVAKAGDEE
jgi:hypothetical protein